MYLNKVYSTIVCLNVYIGQERKLMLLTCRRYDVVDTEKVKLFNCPNPSDLIAVGRKKFKNSKSCVSQYYNAAMCVCDYNAAGFQHGYY